jgi:lysozyme family protein
MNGDFERALKFTLREEGGFVNNPKDPGGATMMGITLETFQKYRKNPHLTADDLKLIPHSEVAEIYQKRYWDACKCNDLPQGVDLCVFDTAVNSGPGRASKMLQEAVGATADGVIGPGTLSKVSEVSPVDLIGKYCDTRLKFLRSLPTFPTFGKGWTARVERLKQEATAWLK